MDRRVSRAVGPGRRMLRADRRVLGRESPRARAGDTVAGTVAMSVPAVEAGPYAPDYPAPSQPGYVPEYPYGQ